MKSRDDFKTDGEYREYLRKYFAAMAMQGILSKEAWALQIATDKTAQMVNTISKASVVMAEALLSELEKTK